jgi:galactose mutarotase-like enzyme
LATPPRPWISIASAELSAQIDPLGAQLSVLRDGDGNDLLWNGDPSVWSGRAPLLFPIVGTLNDGEYRVAGKPYKLPRHGFARVSQFEVIASDSDTTTLRLTADPATLAVYPFKFQLDLEFAVTGARLSIAAHVKNLGNEPMPASFGYHPAIRWPLPYGEERSGHAIEFERDEPAPVRRLNAKGLLAPAALPTPVSNRRLNLSDALFVDDALIFDQLRSTQLTYGATRGPKVKVSFPDTSYLGLWSKPNAPFVCIEPWAGIADPDDYRGEFADKPGVFMVAAHATRTLRMLIEVC